MKNFYEMQTVKFKLKPIQNFEPVGSCGVYALSYITGLKLSYIDKFTPKKGWWSDKDILKFLKNLGYKYLKICDSTIHRQKLTGKNYYEKNINHLNVVLISQHTTKEEGSWAVVYDNRYYHGTEVEFFSGYELLVNPLWTGYVIFHPKWKSSAKQIREKIDQNFLAIHKICGKKNINDYYHPSLSIWHHSVSKKFK
jgi:hypothetical protein